MAKAMHPVYWISFCLKVSLFPEIDSSKKTLFFHFHLFNIWKHKKSWLLQLIFSELHMIFTGNRNNYCVRLLFADGFLQWFTLCADGLWLFYGWFRDFKYNFFGEKILKKMFKKTAILQAHAFNCAFSSTVLMYMHKSLRNSTLTLLGLKKLTFQFQNQLINFVSGQI